jgi:DASH complex subunit DAD3
MAASSTPGSEIFVKNPYESHPNLAVTEAEVLWEYAKLAQHVKEATTMTRNLSEAPDKKLLTRLRVLEKKMGLVMTLFKASVWGVINEKSVVEHVQSHGEGTTIRH